ncbi:MAG: hypothetical protein ACI4UV_07060 [Victivallales bacterium]
MFKKSMLVALAGVLMLQLTACGTLFHAERKGQQASTQVDPTVLILDCCGLLFGIIPGVVAIVIDYSNKTIYYTKAEVKAMNSASIDSIDRSKMVAVKMDEMSNEAIEQALSRQLGQQVKLADLQVVAAQ